MRFFTILMILAFIATAFASDKKPEINRHRFFEVKNKLKKIKLIDIPTSEPQTKIPYRKKISSLQKSIMVADKIQTDHSVAVKIDSSRNGYGWLDSRIRSIDYYSGMDAMGFNVDFVVAGYRQYILANEATGIIGATTVDVSNGLENGTFYRHEELNQDLYGGTIGGRYPGVVALERPFIHFNQYVSGNPEATPPTPAISHPYLITDYGSYGDNGGLWTGSFIMDEGYHHYNFTENRLWDGPVEIVKGTDGNYHYVGVYSNWTVKGESQPYDYVILNAQTDDPTNDWTIDTNPTVIDTMNYMIVPDISMNSSGLVACIGVGHMGYFKSNLIKDFYLMARISEDYGKTFSDVRQVGWQELGIPEQITKDDSIYVPANPDDPNDTTMVLYEGHALVGLYTNADVLVDGNNNIYVAYDLLWGPIASDSSFYISPLYSGLHVAISKDKGKTFKDYMVCTYNGFYVGDSSSDEVQENLILDSEADLSADESGNIYLTWIDRPHKDIEAAEKPRYSDSGELTTLKADVFSSRSLDGGETWTWKMNVTKTKNVDEYEIKASRRASSKNNGTVYFAYCEVDPNTTIPIGSGLPDAYVGRINRVWIGEAFNYPDSTVGIPDKSKKVATNYVLFQNYPNPFNPATTIKFQAAKSGKAMLQVFDVNGRLINTIFNAPVQAHHEYQVKFNGTNLASGIYFYRLRVNDQMQTRKMVLMR